MKGKLLCVWVSICALCTLMTPLAMAQRTSRFEESVGQVHAVDESGTMRSGSCTVLSRSRLVTCYHCVGTAKYAVCTIKGISFFARVTNQDSKNDIANLVPVETPSLNVPSINAAYKPAAGDQLIAYGFPARNGAQRIQPLQVVDSGRSRKQDGIIVLSRPSLATGMSGGGAFTPQGELVGILQFNLTPRRMDQEPDQYTNTCGLVLLDGRGEIRQ